MKPTDEQVEVGAIALRTARNVLGVGDPSYPWEHATEMSKRAYRHEARAVLEAVDVPAPTKFDRLQGATHGHKGGPDA